jgi:hypothetical protein
MYRGNNGWARAFFALLALGTIAEFLDDDRRGRLKW